VTLIVPIQLGAEERSAGATPCHRGASVVEGGRSLDPAVDGGATHTCCSLPAARNSEGRCGQPSERSCVHGYAASDLAFMRGSLLSKFRFDIRPQRARSVHLLGRGRDALPYTEQTLTPATLIEEKD